MNFHQRTKRYRVCFFVIMISMLFLFSGCGASKNMLAGLFKDTSVTEENTTTTDPDAAYQLARHFQKQGKHRLAVTELLKVVRAAPDHANAYNALGVSYDRLREFDSAAAAYREALKIDSSLAYVYNNMGYSRLLQGNLEEAAAAFETAVSLDGGKPRYHNNLDLARARLGKAPVMPSATVAAVPEKTPAPVIPLPETAERPKAVIIEDLPENDTTDTPVPDDVYYTIQLGVFYDLDKAMAALKQAKNDELDVPYITKVDRRGPYRPYYRVRAGKYQDRDRAARLAAGIQTETPMPAYVTQVTATPEKTEKIQKTDDIIKKQRVASLRTKPVIIQTNADIEILNGNGVRHMARGFQQYLVQKGMPVDRISNAPHFFHPRTVIYYSPGYYGRAKQILARFHEIDAGGKMIKSGSLDTGIRIVLGRDVIPVAGKLGHLMKEETPPA